MTQASDTNFYRDLDKRYPVIVSAKGVNIYDDAGNEYIDFGSGISVASIGYSVSEVTRRMTEQLAKTTFVYTGCFTSQPVMELSKKLTDFCPEGINKAIFASSGSEANEVAIKIARQYHIETGSPEKYRIISRRLSYHGNTLGSLSASGRNSWREHFLPYMYDFPQIAPPYCYRCPFALDYPGCGVRCAHDLEDVITSQGPETFSAFIAEPIIGTTVAGVTPPPEYYGIIRAICDKYNLLFIADEVITGIGRTGRNFGIEHWNVTPDIITVAKGLAAGYAPLSAIVVHDGVFEAFAKGSRKHSQGFTHSDNPLSCAAGVAVLDYVEANNLVDAAKRRGEYLLNRLETLRDIDIVGDVRGKGLLLGIEFVADKETKAPFPAEAGLTARIVTKAFEMGVFLVAGLGGCADGVHGDQIQISPALVISEEQIDKVVEIMRVAIEQSAEEVS